MNALDIRVAVDGANLRINAPKGALNPTLRRRITEHKQLLVNLLGPAEPDQLAASDPIPRAPAGRTPPSFAQERLWFLEQLEPGNAIFNLCRALRIAGRLDITALEASLNDLVQRHQALRSRFVADGGAAAVEIAPFRPARLTITDLSHLDADRRARESDRMVRDWARRRFNLGRGRLLRAKILRQSTAEHLLILCTHHLVCDAWSMGILMSQLWAHYEALVRGDEPRWPELAVQYRDYALWQRRQLRGERFAALLAYWRAQLAGAAPLALPTDRARPAQPTFRGRQVPLVIPQSTTLALNDLARRHNATLFMTLLAAFQLLLHRYTGQDTILVGTPVANRNRPELESVIGLFVNTLVLRGDFTGAPSFAELLRRVRAACLDAYACQEMPFEKLIEALNPQREPNRQPLFQSMFVLQNTPRHSAKTPSGLDVAAVAIDNQAAQFDLSLYLRERDGNLLGYFEYACDLFDDATIERMAGHFITLLHSIVGAAERPAAALAMLGAAERHRMLVQWNGSTAELSAGSTIHERFEAQAARSANSVALESDGERMTYGELNRRANQLARYLQHLGVGAQQPVGILAERSAELVVGLLAILKAGGAYLPLDPSYPDARLRFMIEDARAAVLITTAKLIDKRGRKIDHGDPALRLVLIDTDRTTIDKYATTNPPSEVAADHAAYVIYTSGSTGAPKGVIGLHRGAVNRLAWMWRSYPFRSGEVCCVKTSIGFVDSVWEIFGPLLQGVRLVMVPDEVARQPRRLIAFLADRGVSRIVLVPSLLRALLDESVSLGQDLPRLRLWSCSGEELPRQIARQFKSSHPRARLLNLYGSAEVAADVTCFEYGERGHPSRHAPVSRLETQSTGSAVAIGRPIDNCLIYVLDGHGQPVPIGVGGELFVGGAGVARGYWHRPDLSAEKFSNNPFVQDVRARLFRSGDRARYRPDGTLEFLGRMDQQVKIRGQRVELGEVEAVLDRHPLVRASVVVARHDGTKFQSQIGDAASRSSYDEKYLAAYLVTKGSKRPSAASWQDFLRQNLPEFMIPARYVTLDRLPLTASGKLDRNSLPAPGSMPAPKSRSVRQPRTALEKQIAAIWRELLPTEKVGVDDNFFALGGHSLLAATLIARLGARLGRQVSLGDFLAEPTITAVAEKIDAVKVTGSAGLWPPIAARTLEGELPLSLAQEQFLKLDELISGAAFLHLPYAYRLTGRLELTVLRQALQAIVDRHAVLRTNFRHSHGHYVQVVRRRRMVVCPLRDLSRLAAQRQAERLVQLSRDDAQRPFELTAGPPCRFTLVRLAERRHVLLVTMHHIIADQFSLRLFRAELAKFYRAIVRGRATSSFDLPFQFADFTQWQTAMLKSGRLNGQIDYWRRVLNGPTRTLNFHRRGRSRPRTLGAGVSRRTLTFDDSCFAALRLLARERKTTPFIILLAALDVWLYRLTGCRDVRVGTLVANRDRPGAESVIGYFANALVLRANLAPRMTFAQVIEQARDAMRGALAHQDLPIEMLARALQKKGLRRRAALFQVLVNYRRFDFKSQKVAGLTIASHSSEERAAVPEVAFTSADVNFEFREESPKLTLSVNFKEALFDPAALTPLIESYAKLVHQAVARPERRLAKFILAKID